MRYAFAAAFAALFALPAAAHDGLEISDAYARVAGPAAKAGAIFMVIENHTGSDDRLVGASTDAAAKAQLHSHVAGDGGMMRMIHVEDGFVIPAGGQRALARGGDHVMLMGLSRSLSDGDTIGLTLTFEKAGEMTVDVPVDNARGEAGGHGHGAGMKMAD